MTPVTGPKWLCFLWNWALSGGVCLTEGRALAPQNLPFVVAGTGQGSGGEGEETGVGMGWGSRISEGQPQHQVRTEGAWTSAVAICTLPWLWGGTGRRREA